MSRVNQANNRPAVIAPSASNETKQSLNDADLAATYEQLMAAGEEALFVVNKYTAAMFSRKASSAQWGLAASGEFADECLAAVRANTSKKRTSWGATTCASPGDADPTTLNLALAKKGTVAAWLKGADQATGRFGHASPEVKKEVAYLAAHRCQFSGCGKDLGMHAGTGTKGTFSYFAHIVAASADGPRGDPVESEKLVNDPSNFLLLCDECHRLVDKVAPHDYSVTRLREMRSQAIHEVRRALDTLQYPEADAISILGNVTGQMPHISERDIDESLWKSRLRRSSKGVESYFSFGGAHHTPHQDSYWSAAFTTLKFNLLMLQAKLNGVSASGAPRQRLAVFPLHGTSILILAGRILGDMSGTHVFQPHRNQVGQHEQTRWAWPEDAIEPKLDKFKVEALHAHTSAAEEANLVVSLTAPISDSRLAGSSTGSGLRLPTIEISVEQFGHSTIRHPRDLALFGLAVDEALKTLQDQWRIKKLHLYVCAPASAALMVGQKLQARHHANVVCYESLPGKDAPYAPTIEISSHDVKVVGSNLSVSLQT